MSETVSALHFSKVVIVGVGLIGGSLALSLKRAGVVGTVVGVGRSAASLDKAKALGVIDEAASLEDAMRGASLVVLCAPVAQNFALLHALEPHLQPGTIVTDAGSTKSDVIMAAKTALGDKVAQFVPAHPIAGRELNGVEAALDDLYVGKKVVLCPLQENSRADVAAVRAMWEATGADCHVMSAVQHDAVFASVSHLPHLLSYALVAQVANAEDAALKLDFAGGGFRDFTRIAASSPEMWRDICIANKDALLREISIYESVLAHLKTKIKEGDGAALERLFARASDTRLKWGAARAAANNVEP
ncbi:MAG: prephenate dehydrogenase/arogenate dehydrogenase family protein [Burkholderiaceae bacterium]|jgi:prephenate dehydrogenase|uniref:prephenate dehydrogenase n=1 Tax=Cupriavidus metallidurans TaxID=119219 RepID=A0A132HIC6_9BURK|nr:MULTISPECIES: prephenate dehydrogenase/arogenate dehydrogenase family protein [Cupriavidus]PCH57935.1 MAG: prephenate dehydrogenase/arogenate dehydrogenase family protein [Burkholderiaceae bacterium]KWR79858.1 prephenate dehydrogenase [Cupriavidus sp. SHE]KWW36415.1 Prephenate dehydrogenase [Cupriavidus metallidurans]QBP08897.1 prephenate dehydrogenase/arogenate dehydrogenase family protein [Cupriavidus metallidurans]QWC89327.1 prephenate dehydrogenase/arogenate dehydrogenase family protein